MFSIFNLYQILNIIGKEELMCFVVSFYMFLESFRGQIGAVLVHAKKSFAKLA
jgi:hypothetical protein